MATQPASTRLPIERAEMRQAAVATLGQQALAGMGHEELAASAATLLATIMDVPFVEVLQLSSDRRRLLLVAGVGWADGLVGSATVEAGLGSQGGYTLATVRPVVLDQLATETRFTPPPLLCDHGVVSGLTVVIGSPAHPYGVLGAHTAHHRVFAADEVNFLQAIANVLAAAIERRNNEIRLNSLAVAEQSRAAQLKAAIDSMGDAVVVLDALGAVYLSNPAADALLGAQLPDGLAGIMRAFDWPVEVDPIELEPGQGIELRLASIDGGPGPDRWIELSGFPVLADGRSLASRGGSILVLRDVTAARNERSAREAFLGVLSHELRTPVTTIYGGAEVLARESATLSEETRREVYADIRAEADRLYRLVENLLVLSRVERHGLQIDAEPVLLQRLIPRAVDAEAARWPAARWMTEVPPGLPPVAGDETYVEQVLRNLLGNAAKYGGDGPVRISAAESGATVAVSVCDSGPGLDEADAERLFDLFYRTPSAVRRASGAGIGLFVSRQLVQAMNGEICARDGNGGGAEFAFALPVFATASD